MRAYLAASCAIALLFAGSLTVVELATRDASAGGSTPARVEANAASAIPSPAPGPAGIAAVPPAVPPPDAPAAVPGIVPGIVHAPAPEAPASAALRAATPRGPAGAARPMDREALFTFRRELRAGLARLAQRVATCELPRTPLTLSVETVQGGLRIVDAVAAGPAGDGALECAKSALRGQVIAAPSARPGSAWQMPFTAGAAM